MLYPDSVNTVRIFFVKKSKNVNFMSEIQNNIKKYQLKHTKNNIHNNFYQED